MRWGRGYNNKSVNQGPGGGVKPVLINTFEAF